MRVLGRVGTYDGRLQIELRDLEKLERRRRAGAGARAPAATPRRWTAWSSSWPARSTTRAAALVAASWPTRLPRPVPRRAGAETHHAYAGGLLEHTVAVAAICRETAQLHPRLNGDQLLAAALLHDVGRTETFRPGVTISVSDEGRLIGHVLAGVRMIDGAARELALDEDALLPLLNAVAGHHGPLEGRRLETPEAVALHRANTLDARVAEAL